MLLLHLIFLQNLLLFISSISVGRGKLQKERHGDKDVIATAYSEIKSFATCQLISDRGTILIFNLMYVMSKVQ